MPASYYDNVDASVDLQTDGHAGLIVRGTLTGLGGYVVRLAAGSDQVIVTRMVDGEVTATRSAARTVQVDTTYHLRVTAVGDTVTVWVGGDHVLQWQDPNPLPGGAIGLRVVGGQAFFDQLQAHRA